ncbi:SCO family protein [Acidiluteibacter ferrifornacis]|uniref:SCO family protein n=1 Tax=Acidiluteibacter ferrifornacis TaxID=2692424 RepID=A0A6N9NFW9_9FLAO|nr:SCO family protein [Acidiluteibacter ferrifornacis]NBG64773.1 SCO family protein [Acidiluteibacter ferrifornacis]
MAQPKTLKKAAILIAILLVPSLLYLLLSTGTNNFKPLPYMGPKKVVEVEKDGRIVVDTIYHTIPPFEFIDQNGQLFSSKALEDKIYVANFFFATCPTICPKMSTNMLQVQDRFQDRDDFRLLSFTVNPEHDTPEVLKEYAEKVHATDGVWTFLTGNKDSIYSVGFNGYFVSAQKDSIAPGGFLHSSNLMLIDGEGRLRGVFDGTSVSETNDLFDAIDILLVEKYVPRKGK